MIWSLMENSSDSSLFFPYFEFSKSLILFQEEIFTPSFLVASYLKGINFNKKVYLYGFKGIAQELTDAGIDFIGLGVSIQIRYQKLCHIFKNPSSGPVPAAQHSVV